MISRWIERWSMWRTCRRFRRWHRTYAALAPSSAANPGVSAASTWETPVASAYDKPSYELNVLADGRVVDLRGRAQGQAVLDLMRLIRRHPRSRARAPSAEVDEYIYSMF